ncbi:response regulator [Maritimibacter dapengensis]|uniref:Response regulator n=1 Tax=Maritimibacter dapengensis TaxID=2836868 RepID=A0ABS6T6K5_9RHOB|nr:response regulator [Maritimibacter dapengensis]MBV7380156.1 response regulator [Maritimibacter dapengensis]
MNKLERILHVDDDEDIRALTKMALEMVGHYQVQQFESGEDALNSSEDLVPQLFLLDYMMPGISGVELWRKLRDIPGLEDVPAVFITAKSEDTFAENLVDEGALAVIVKPFEIARLCELIEEAWQKHQSDA